jgi:hypothetical protein
MWPIGGSGIETCAATQLVMMILDRACDRSFVTDRGRDTEPVIDAVQRDKAATVAEDEERSSGLPRGRAPPSA